MKVLIFLACSLWTVNAASLKGSALDEWQLFKQKYNKIYSSDAEEKFRMKTYMNNKLIVSQHQEKFQNGGVTFELGLNKYSDMTPEEFNKVLNGYKRKNGSEFNRMLNGSTFRVPSNTKLPDEVNWTEKGAVTPVKDQSHCGSCWAFSATGSLEGVSFLKTGKLTSLSEQNLVDCSKKDEGCNGGFPSNAFTYVAQNDGIDTEKFYSYEGIDGTCRYDPAYKGASDKGFMNVDPSEKGLQEAVANVGPISVTIDAGRPSFHLYRSGIYNDSDCGKSSNHAVLVVGYGTDNTTNLRYWLVKNSWGESWGDKGYIKMLRDDQNLCGILSEATYPLI